MIHIGNQTACWAATPREPFDYAVASGFNAFEWFPDKKPNGGWDENDLDGAQRRNIRETRPRPGNAVVRPCAVAGQPVAAGIVSAICKGH